MFSVVIHLSDSFRSHAFWSVGIGQEMTSVRSKFLEYDSLDKDHPFLEKRIRVECKRYYQRRLTHRPRTTRNKLAGRCEFLYLHPESSLVFAETLFSLLSSKEPTSHLRTRPIDAVGSWWKISRLEEWLWIGYTESELNREFRGEFRRLGRSRSFGRARIKEIYKVYRKCGLCLFE